MAAFLEISMTGCNMSQRNAVTKAEETNADTTAAQAGQPIQGQSSKHQTHPLGGEKNTEAAADSWLEYAVEKA